MTPRFTSNPLGFFNVSIPVCYQLHHPLLYGTPGMRVPGPSGEHLSPLPGWVGVACYLSD